MDELVREASRLLMEGLGARRVVLFGSRARGTATPDSDLDLLVVADVSGPLPRRMARARRLLEGLGVAADVLVFSPAEVEEYRQWPGHIVRIALREGVVVRDAD